MERVIYLLKERNRYLRKFRETNDGELTRLKSGVFDRLDYFYGVRENILKTVTYIEGLIEEQMNLQDPARQVTEESRSTVKECLTDKDVLVQGILSQDLEILSLVEEQKNTIIKDLQQVTQSRKLVNAYHGRGINS